MTRPHKIIGDIIEMGYFFPRHLFILVVLYKKYENKTLIK